MTTVQSEVEKDFRYNFVVNLVDGSFFGLAMGYASAVTILPLFIANFTDSTILIGLIGSIHMIGSQLPQILMVGRVANLERYKPLAVLMTMHERLPFIGLMLLALASPQMGGGWVVLLCYLLFIWHALGSGFAATPYQSMISKIFPERHRGTFLGAQMAGYSLLSGLGAVMAGIWLQSLPTPYNYALCFLAASLALGISWYFLARAREPLHTLRQRSGSNAIPWSHLRQIWNRDHNFRGFVLARVIAQLTLVTLSFLAIYATRSFAVSEQMLGLLTGLLFFMQIVGALVGGWMGDRAGHRVVLMGGALLMALAAVLAAVAADSTVFFAVYALAGAGSAILMTNVITMTMEFGAPEERPHYIGLANTLTAFAALVAPLIAGAVADRLGYNAMFILTAVAGVTAFAALQFVADPRRLRAA